ncbi:permease [Candidatus Peregrinibacteria bacterium]|nr:permease [Candidatus Peregrinibacteria bacterium]
MLQSIAGFITFRLFHLQPDTPLAVSVNFFFYDVFKILFLIFTVVTVINFIRTFFEPNQVKETVGKMRWGLGNIVAALFGAVTPFCSCSSIPLFIGFIEARIATGIAFSFLITSPLVNEVAFVIMGGLFGWRLAFLYALSGIVLGVIGGLLIGALKMDKEIILENAKEKKNENYMPKTFHGKLAFALRIGKNTFKKLLPYVIGGVGIGAMIHGYVPQEFFMETVGRYEMFSVVIATLMGIPIYAGCSTVVPLIFSITANGVPLGTSLAFMMAIAGLSLPEAIILKRVMRLKLLAAFFGIVAIGIIMVGYLFNTLYALH